MQANSYAIVANEASNINCFIFQSLYIGFLCIIICHINEKRGICHSKCYYQQCYACYIWWRKVHLNEVVSQLFWVLVVTEMWFQPWKKPPKQLNFVPIHLQYQIWCQYRTTYFSFNIDIKLCFQHILFSPF